MLTAASEGYLEINVGKKGVLKKEDEKDAVTAGVLCIYDHYIVDIW